MARTHINPVTQKEGTCTAKPGNCMYKNEDGTEGNLEQIETDEEWDMIEEVFNTFMSEEE